MATVSLEKLVKRYGAVEVVHGIDLEVADREFIALVGPSGCGKSTTLRMIAGLEPISAGNLRIGGNIVNDLPPRARNLAMVFQSYALYPHMSVYDNMAYGLRNRGTPKAEIDERVKEAARILEITPFL
ncbi:MAG: ATP-binding cassette domain-containing protein, partial [Proteobacteria bacterium]|nr:ATP-binding cassette domain-containing protein [Pseudomonadota bacterium]